jgi:hypothetical protein
VVSFLRKSVPAISLGVKAAVALGWQSYRLHEPKFWETQHPGSLRVCPGLYVDCLYLVEYRKLGHKLNLPCFCNS